MIIAVIACIKLSILIFILTILISMYNPASNKYSFMLHPKRVEVVFFKNFCAAIEVIPKWSLLFSKV
ncbi:hypothetical protein H9Q08_05130 [Chryseobacterium sp. PS-8]|uniref:Secreted protein n=1 Tax=Chryseobacterium indicum TaxID=2766954 RepID=A0ABS9C2G8_9FLAO|nr:hypothetical protein [Chryseobacterium sp. PS-8]MCF2218681.1 hypothetical protein [Chryseobacterium sp. PS-8]